MIRNFILLDLIIPIDMQKKLFPTEQIIVEALEEMARAEKKHPRWPTHIAAQAGIVVEEAGELMREALIHKYEKKGNTEMKHVQPDRRVAMRKEAIQTIASAIRFIKNLK